MASTTKQVWQSVGTDAGNDSVSGELLQLDLAAYSIQHNSRFGRAGLTTRSWSWHDIATYPTII